AASGTVCFLRPEAAPSPAVIRRKTEGFGGNPGSTGGHEKAAEKPKAQAACGAAGITEKRPGKAG
ncbi:MAG: hypothetical protein ACI4VM_04525, partial [Anaerovoracaceae bacterium]